MGPSDGDNYKVGPGKPPLQHRFAAGRSGNPTGRPKKHKAVCADELSLGELILSEGNRLVTIKEGGKPTTLPVAQAVLRALLATAGKGNAHAQRTFLKLNLDAEAQATKARFDVLSVALRAKFALEEARDEWVAAGRDEMSMEVHPSDIEINGLTGVVKTYLALTDEQRAARVTVLKELDAGHAVLARSVATVAEEADDALLQLGREIAVIKILVANELLPSRLRRPLAPQFTVSAETAAKFLSGNWGGVDDVRSALALKLNAGA